MRIQICKKVLVFFKVLMRLNSTIPPLISSFGTSFKYAIDDTWFYHLPFKDFLLKLVSDNELDKIFWVFRSNHWYHVKNIRWIHSCELSLKDSIKKHKFYHFCFGRMLCQWKC